MNPLTKSTFPSEHLLFPSTVQLSINSKQEWDLVTANPDDLWLELSMPAESNSNATFEAASFKYSNHTCSNGLTA